MINKKNLSPQLVNWIQSQGIGPGIGDIFFLVPTESATAQFGAWLRYLGIPTGYYGSNPATMYDKMTTGRNDTLVVLPGSYTYTAVELYNKSYTHILGASAPNIVNSRCRFTATAAGTPLVTFSGSGSIFKNLMWSQDGTHATNYAVNGYITGARNYFENCTWRNLGALAYVDASMRNLKFGAGDGENWFNRCTIGADTVDGGTAANYAIEFVTDAEQGRNTFEACNILGNGSASFCFILAGSRSLTAWNKFDRCLFYNPTLGAYDSLTQAFNIHASANGEIMLMDSLVHGATALETTDSGFLFVRNADAAATGGRTVTPTG